MSNELVEASRSGHLEVVKFLVEKGADITAEENYALRLASENGHLEVAKFLAEKGADIAGKENLSVYFGENVMIDQFLNNKTKDDNKPTFLKMCDSLGLHLTTMNNVHYWFERDGVRFDCWPSTLRIKGDNGVNISRETHFDFTERRLAIVELITSLVEVRPVELDGFEEVAQVYGRVKRLQHKDGHTALWDCKHSYSICNAEDTCYLSEFSAPPLEYCDGWLIYEGVA